MSSSYRYDITDFLNDVIDETKLYDEVTTATGISTQFSYLNVRYISNDVDFYFDSDLSSEEESVLDGIVASHDGVPYSTVTLTWAESESESATTSSDYIEKLSLPINIPSGTYKIGWYFEGAGTTQDYYGYRVQLDDTVDVFETTLAFTKSYSDGMFLPVCGFKYVNLNAGDHNIDIDYKNTGSHTTYIRNARIEIEEV